MAFDNLDDPKRQALLMLAAGLLSPTQAKGGAGVAQALSRAIPMGLLGYNEASQNKRRNSMEDMQRKMHEMQLGQMQRQADDQAYGAQIAPQFFNPGNAPADGMGPAMPPKQDFAGYGAALAGRNPAMAMPYIQAGMKDTTPIAVKPGESLVDRHTFAPKFTAPEKTPDWKDPAYQEFMMRKAAAGKTSVSIDNKMGNSMASELGKGTAAVLDAGRAKAESARDAIVQGHQILGALDSGATFTGPAATVRLKGAQVAQLFGFNPDVEGIKRTREVVTGLANQTLNARGLLKGQGQVTEYEQKTLEKAKSGNIDDMTADEIRAVVRVNERISRAQIAAHSGLVSNLGKRKEFAEAMPFYSIDAPPEYARKQVMPTPDEVAAEFERRMRRK